MPRIDDDTIGVIVQWERTHIGHIFIYMHVHYPSGAPP